MNTIMELITNNFRAREPSSMVGANSVASRQTGDSTTATPKGAAKCFATREIKLLSMGTSFENGLGTYGL
jgi:hypothetical protein